MPRLYALFAYLGVMTPTAAFIYGFRYDPSAPTANYLYNTGLFVGFVLVHLVMTRPWFKRAAFGKPEGAPVERRIYISTAILTWVLLFILHRPLPGPALEPPEWLRFLGLCAMLACQFAFFEGTTFERLNGLLGVPGAAMSHSHGAETPLLTEGSYAKVRHPMYRAALLSGLFSLLIHPNAGQLLWALFFGATFVAFIPFEESLLLKARGDAYRAYMERTRFRLFPGLW